MTDFAAVILSLGSCSTNIGTYTIQKKRRKMVEIEQVLHMNGGDGNTSYAMNSLNPVSSLSLSLNVLFSCISTSFLFLF